MGRSRSKWANAKKGRAASYSQPFVGHLVGMLESPAYRVLTLSARRVLDRLEIELLRHGGNENGRLAVTYRQFEDWTTWRLRDRSRRTSRPKPRWSCTRSRS